MTKVTRQKSENIYRRARNMARKSRTEAAWEMHISDRTLARHELDESVPSPDYVASMSEYYKTPWLEDEYCQKVCAIGRRKHMRNGKRQCNGYDGDTAA